jgi:cyclohexyl-isocyanide hydratase
MTTFGFLIFNKLTQLDFTGPVQFLNRMPKSSVLTIAKTKDPIGTDCGFSILPTHSIDEVKNLDAICIPGGAGIQDVMQDKDTMDFIKDVAPDCQYVSSVCTGAFVLGSAGLLDNKDATTHWAYQHLLPMVGAKPVDARFVRDGNVFTGGGVTAGIDFAINFIEEVYDRETASNIKLAFQYDQPTLNINELRMQEGKKEILDSYKIRADSLHKFLIENKEQSNDKY